jgi:hypothetical protein
LKLMRQATDLGNESRKKRPKSAINMSEVALPTKRVLNDIYWQQFFEHEEQKK